MNQRGSLLKYGIAGRTVLSGLGAGLALLTVGSIAQTPIPAPVVPPMQTPGTTPVQTPGATPVKTPQNTPTPPSDTPKIPANPPRVSPGNPLVLTDATHTAPPTTQELPKKEFQDYTKNATTGPKRVGAAKDLPLFGYSYFAAVRDIVDAHREYVRRVQRERVNGTTNGSSNSSNSGQNGNGNTGRQSNGNSNNGNSNNGNSGNATNGASGVGAGSRSNNNTNSGNASGSNGNNGNNGNSGNNTNDYTNDPLNINRNYTDTTGTRNTRGGTIDNTDVNGSDTRMDVSDPLTQLINNVAATVPANYQIGPGDTIVFSYWSPTIERSTLARTVDPQGQITIEGLAPIVLLGKTVASAENTLKEQLSRFYKNVQVSLTLNKLRTIQVTVSGDAYQPGTYSVPSVASMYNLLYFSGGPTDNGSLRNIELLRGGKVVGKLDMYKFMLGEPGTTDYPLQAGDMLIVPPRLSRIAVTGEVLRPAIYELTPTESLADALRYAGGTRPSAVSQSVRINTLDPGKARIIQDVNVNDLAAVRAQKLYDGDEVEVSSVRTLVVNSVRVEGAVDQPNDYPLTPNMRCLRSHQPGAGTDQRSLSAARRTATLESRYDDDAGDSRSGKGARARSAERSAAAKLRCPQSLYAR